MALPFRNLYRHGFIRAAMATPRAYVGDVRANAAGLVALAKAAAKADAALMLAPELSLTSYAIDDLHLQDALLDAVEEGLALLAAETAGLNLLLVVGAPLRQGSSVYNCAIAIKSGRMLGVVPKIYLPNYREYYEKRYFASGRGVRGAEITIAGAAVPFGVDLLFAAEDQPDCVIGVEICEDMWAPLPPSTHQALAGATVLLNLSASNVVIGKAEERLLLAKAHATRTASAYLYSAAGPGESTTDLAWDGQAFAVELGEVIAEGKRYPEAAQLTFADIDLDRLRQERMRVGTFRDCAEAANLPAFRRIGFSVAPPVKDVPLQRRVERFPYAPATAADLNAQCREAYEIQVQGLVTRLRAARAETAVIGVSGGLDSTQALIVAVKAMDRLGRPRTAVKAYTMPGFATSDGTKANAWALMRALGVSAAEIDIRPAANQMLADLGHPFAKGEPAYDVTFENVQAGLRTDYLFRLANHQNGLVIGTGDLSELALGWCTYGVGDHMSHYGVNASVAKTLIQHLIRWCARAEFNNETASLLEAILAQEISPELVPAGADGKMQSTQDRIGPYALHDFTLFYISRFGLRPSKIAFLAEHAWANAEAGAWPEGVPAESRVAYALPEIKSWMGVFLQRFFATSQFKRSALPNGPKVATGGSLSPRGDWRAPSDASAAPWLEELAQNTPS